MVAEDIIEALIEAMVKIPKMMQSISGYGVLRLYNKADVTNIIEKSLICSHRLITGQCCLTVDKICILDAK